MAETKFCDNCNAEVGASEENCPKCQSNFKEMDELAEAIENGTKIVENRRKRNAPAVPAAPAAPSPENHQTVSNRLRGLGRAIKRG